VRRSDVSLYFSQSEIAMRRQHSRARKKRVPAWHLDLGMPGTVLSCTPVILGKKKVPAAARPKRKQSAPISGTR
jgi:hypothetical protein